MKRYLEKRTMYVVINGKKKRAPTNAIAYKYEDPVEGARWVYDESDLNEIKRADPSLIVQVGPFKNPKSRRAATAKQIVWRKKFAAMAKSGRLRKGKRRAKNPSRTYGTAKSTMPDLIKHWRAYAKRYRATPRVINEGISAIRSEPEYWAMHESGWPALLARIDAGTLKRNPRVKTRRIVTRAKNPVAGFDVSIGVGGSRTHKIATFRDKSRAIEYAKALHRRTNRRVTVTH